MAVGDLSRVDLQYNSHGIIVLSSWGFRSLIAADTWRQTLVDDFFTTHFTNLRACLATGVFISALSCVDVVPGTVGPVIRATGLPVGGSRAGSPCPNQCAVVIQHRSNLIGRSNRGRVFLAGAPTTDASTTVNQWTAAYLTVVQTFCSAMLARYGPAGTSTTARLVTISRQLDGVERVPPVGVDVSAIVPVAAIGTQRRRTR